MSSTVANPQTPSKKVAAELAKVDMNKGSKDAKPSTEVARAKFVGDEPLLVESSRRFVLFPIRYHEVSKGWMPSKGEDDLLTIYSLPP
jgi:hypothetical protein